MTLRTSASAAPRPACLPAKERADFLAGFQSLLWPVFREGRQHTEGELSDFHLKGATLRPARGPYPFGFSSPVEGTPVALCPSGYEPAVILKPD